MTTETHTIPDETMAIAAELANATIRNYERNERANVARNAIAKTIHDAVMAERERCAEIVEAKAIDIYRNDDEGIDAYAIGQIIVAALKAGG